VITPKAARSLLATRVLNLSRLDAASSTTAGLEPSVVDGVADVVPELGLDLPFINEAGRHALEEQARVGGEGLPRCQRVDANLAARGATTGLGLANGLGSRYDDGTHGVKRGGKWGVDHALAVVHAGRVALNGSSVNQ
jgi:hypothetical protein